MLFSVCLAHSVQHVSIDTTSARAVLRALHDPHLTHEKAMEIAKLTGNQGMIRKMLELKEAETDEQFADALFATAHDQAAGRVQEKRYNFAAVKASTPAISLPLDQVEHGLQKDIRDRIRPYIAKPEALG